MTLPPPAPSLPAPSPAGPPPAKPKARRPAFALLALAGIAVRLARDVSGNLWGPVGALVAAGVGVAAIVTWRLVVRSKARKRGGHELTPAEIRDQIVRAGGLEPAYPEDGTLRGASVLVVNQRSKLLEVQTQYDVYGSNGEAVAHVLQHGQSGWKQAARILTSFDQFFTHHLDITDADGALALRITRPRKVFRSRINVYDAANTYLGCLRQVNVFGHIRFSLFDAADRQLAELRAENWRAWDFTVTMANGTEVARITKSWEGWMRTFASTADRYVVRIHHRLGDPLHALVLATALSVDLALKQDARGFG